MYPKRTLSSILLAEVSHSAALAVLKLSEILYTSVSHVLELKFCATKQNKTFQNRVWGPEQRKEFSKEAGGGGSN